MNSSSPKKTLKIEPQNPFCEHPSPRKLGDFHSPSSTGLADGCKRKYLEIDISEEARRYKARLKPLPPISTIEEIEIAVKELAEYNTEKERQILLETEDMQKLLRAEERQKHLEETLSESELEIMKILLPAYFNLMIEGHPPFPKRKDIEVAKAYAANERPPFEAPVKYYAYGLRQLIQDCWDEKPSKRPNFKEIIVNLDAINKHLVQKRRWKTST